MTSSESEEQPRSRKRQRTAASNTDSQQHEPRNKRARGRPRVDAEDSTAADRRRTQIRLAQRAYRQRKETTISELKERNSQLKSAIEKMNQSFTRFKALATEMRLDQWSNLLDQELNKLTDTFAGLVKGATMDCCDDESSDNPVEPAPESENTASTAGEATNLPPALRNQFSAANLQHPWLFPTSADYSTTDISGAGLVPTEGTSAVSMPSYVTTEESLLRGIPALSVEQASDQPISSTTVTTNWSPELPFGLVVNLDQMEDYQGHQLTPPISRRTTPSFLSSPWTYSYDETTFSRKLSRAAFESGWHLLGNKNAPQKLIKSIFKLSLSYMTAEQLRERFRFLLAMGPGEELDCGGTPYLHLGGAGTHYAKRPANSPAPNFWYIRSSGPPHWRRLRAEHSSDPSKNHDLDVDLSAYEGEWFDPDDVEGYLEQEKGCRIDPTQSFAPVLIDEDEDTTIKEVASVGFSRIIDMDLSDLNIPHLPHSPSESLSNESGSGEASSNRDTPPRNMDPSQVPSETLGLDMGMANMGDIGNFGGIDVSTIKDQPLGLDLVAGYCEAPSTSWVGQSTADEDASLVVKQKHKKPAWVDVSKLTEELLLRCICLGRTPGFRRADVDIAFRKSLITAF